MRFLPLLFISLGLCFLAACKEPNEGENNKQIPQLLEGTSKKIPAKREEITLSFAPVVKKVAPAVVNIYAVQKIRLDFPVSPFMKDPFFKKFFEHFKSDEGFMSEQNSLGSGVIISPDGYILTNYHVIQDADVIRVVLSDRREYVVKLAALDKRTDLALLKIDDGTQFQYLEVGAHEALEVGDLVLAIGNPFGVGQTVTSGIISALARSQEGISDFRSFIQTDAAINPGNSGGALITTDGRLVGINTAIFSKTGGSVGIGFAIPTSLAIPIIMSVKNGGHIKRPWLGVHAEAITAKSAKKYGLPRPFGVYVKGVYPQSPADLGGVKVDDLIIGFNNHEIQDDAALEYQVAISKIGQKVNLKIMRDGKEVLVPVELEEPLKGSNVKAIPLTGKTPFNGATAQTLMPANAIDMGLSPMVRGVLITKIAPSSPAAALGLKVGDVVKSINGEKVETAEEIEKLAKEKEDSWLITLHRGEKILTLQLSM